MANITFSWMLDQISSHVSINKEVIKKDARARQDYMTKLNRKHELELAQDHSEAAERSWGQWASHALATAAGTVMYPLTGPKKPEPIRYDMGWGTGTIIDSYTRMYHLNGPKPRTPGGYAPPQQYDAPGSTNEEIHPTVGYRYTIFKNLAEKLDKELMYHPAGLKEGYSREPNAEGRWVYLFPDEVVLREYQIPSDGFERETLGQAWDTEWKDSERKPLSRETPARYMRRLDIENKVNVQVGMA